MAGQRAGLDGARSGLWFEFQRILSELRPRWAIIENVPGLLSSNQGRDFAVILDGLGECGFGGIAWAVLDSRHFGVPQRRRRVFIVCGPTARSAEAVLALCESCGGYPASRGTQGEGVAGEVEDGVAIPLSASGRGTERAGESRGQDTLIAVRTAQTSSNGWGVNEEGLAYTLDEAQGQAVAFHENKSASVTAQDGTAALRSGASHSYQFAAQGASVRRLTPTECLRLQGFPDDWLDGLGLADGPKYRMCGNAVTVPVIEWIGQRIMAVEAAGLKALGDV